MITTEFYPGEMNPYKITRLRLGLTQQKLARLANITGQVITNLESGLYYKAPISVTSYLLRYEGTETLERDYKRWVKYQRKTNQSNREWISERPIDQGWLAFRGPSLRGFCRRILYQPSMLTEYEHHKRNRTSLNYALKDCGVIRDDRTRLLYRPQVIKPDIISPVGLTNTETELPRASEIRNVGTWYAGL